MFRWRASTTRRGVALTVLVTALTVVVAVSAARIWPVAPVAARAGSPPRINRGPVVSTAAPVDAGPPQARVVLSPHAATTAIPASFLGISTEYWSVPMWSRDLPLLDRVLSLVRGDGPVQLRIGGDSADRSFWSRARELPDWVFQITPAWLRNVAKVVRRTHVRLILDLNLVTATPRQSARWARIALAELPQGSISGFEIGNEPDIYSQATWRSATLGGEGSRTLPAQITPAQYTNTFATSAELLQRTAPGIPLLGPALAEPQVNSSWIPGLLAAARSRISAVTVHRYPYSACVAPTAPAYASIARVLSERATSGVARSIGPAVRLSRRAGLPLRVTELNSVTCGGVSGVSNTFATSLWAPDALFELMRTGAASVDVHVRAHAINAAFSLTRHGLVAHPLLYGMILFARMLGPRSRLVSLRLHVKPGRRLKAWAVQTHGGSLHVLLINKGPRSIRIALRLPSTDPVSVVRLLAPSVSARSGTTLGGRWLDARGRWQGPRTVEMLTRSSTRQYLITLRARSAALLTTYVATARHWIPAPRSPMPAQAVAVTWSGSFHPRLGQRGAVAAHALRQLLP